MKGCLVKGYFQDEDRGSEASARTQVYLSKTKLGNTGGDLAVYIVKVQVGVVSHSGVKYGNDESEWSKVWEQWVRVEYMWER